MLEKLEQSEALPVLEVLAQAGAQPHVCAGAVRDVFFCLERGIESEPRDIDIVTFGIGREPLNDLAVSLGASPNRYGGYSFRKANHSSVDVWAADVTCGVVACRAAPTLRNVLRSFVLNLNAIAFEFGTTKFFDMGCISGFRQNQLGLVDDALMHDEDIFAAKALISATRFGLGPSSAVTSLFALNADNYTIRREFGKTETLLGPATNIESLGENFFSNSRHHTEAWVLKKLT